MSNELTPQIAGAYYGCNAIGQDSRRDDFPPCYGVINTITPYYITIEGVNQETGCTEELYHFSPFEVKLLLRPLSALTDDDCAFIYETIIGSTIGENRFSIQRQQGKSITVETVCNIDNSPDKRTYVFIPDSLEIYYTQEGRIEYPDGVRMQEIIDYLRSKGYDCGHNSIPSLISAGIAVEDKTERI